MSFMLSCSTWKYQVQNSESLLLTSKIPKRLLIEYVIVLLILFIGNFMSRNEANETRFCMVQTKPEDIDGTH